MALHRLADRFSNGGKHLTETDYRAFMDIKDDVECYDNRKTFGIMNGVYKALGAAPTAFINGIIIPETRDAIGQQEYSSDTYGDVRPLGKVPPQNMNKTVKTDKMRLGDAVEYVDEINLDSANCRMSIIQQNPNFKNIAHRLLNMYPAGAPLTAAEIRALEKGMLRPVKNTTGGNDGNTAIIYSDGMLCTGYVQMLDDAVQIFKNYFSTLLGKCIKFTFIKETWEVHPKRIVYDTSRAVSCSNPVINEAAQIALECDVIYNGVKSTGLLHLTSTTTTNNHGGNVDAFTTEDFIYNAIYNRLVNDAVAQQLNTPKRCSRFITLLYILGFFQVAPSNKPRPS